MKSNHKIQHTGEGDSLDSFMDNLVHLQIPTTVTKEMAWQTLASNLTSESRKPRTTRRLVIASMAVAASLLLVVGGWYVHLSTRTTTFVAQRGQTQVVTLPDGSLARLNAGTSISLKEHNFANHRLVQLHGEAFFEVQEGSEFVVTSGNQSVKVLGTSFNVYARDNRFDVKCFTGKVLVTTPLTPGVILRPGTMITSRQTSSSLTTSTFDASQPTGWLRGTFAFKNEDLQVVLGEIERQYNVVITRPEIEGRFYTGFFDKNNLHTALTNVCLPMGLRFTMKDSSHIIVSK